MEFLISQGHPPAAAMKYTLKQFRSFVALAWMRVATEQAMMATSVRMAYHADEEAFGNFRETLDP